MEEGYLIFRLLCCGVHLAFLCFASCRAIQSSSILLDDKFEVRSGSLCYISDEEKRISQDKLHSIRISQKAIPKFLQYTQLLMMLYLFYFDQYFDKISKFSHALVISMEKQTLQEELGKYIVHYSRGIIFGFKFIGKVDGF